MEFIKKGRISAKYLSDGCEFKKDNDNYRLVSTLNEKYEPFIGESYGENIWDMISSSDITHGEKHQKLYSLLLDHYKSGNRIFDKEANILLKKDEKVIYKMNNIQLNEPKSVRVTNSAHYGTSHRRGNRSTGIGVSKSVGESHEVIKNVDVGEMVITNKRFIFSGAKRSVDVNISQITGVTAYDNGIKLQRKSKQKAEYFVGVDNYFFTYGFGDEKYFFKLNGNIVKAMIEGGLNKTPQKSKLIEAKKQLENKSKPESSKDHVSIDSDHNVVKLDIPDDWVREKNKKDNYVLSIKKVIDQFSCVINMYYVSIPKDQEANENELLNVLKKDREITNQEHKTINNIDMFTISSASREKDNELIFTHFNDGYIQYCVTLAHREGSSAKSDYFDILNSIKIENKDNSGNSTIFCPNCGRNIDANSNFCMECGYKIK